MISHSLFFSLALVCVSFAHECIHDRVQASITPTVDEQSFTWGVEADNEARKRAAMVDTQPLRVHFDTFNLGETANDCKSVGQQVVVNRETFTCRENDILTRETKDLLLKVFDKLKRELANMFRIVRADSFALNKYDWCYDDTIDISRYYDESSDPIRDATDFMLMVTSWPTGGSTIAWASYCRTNQFGRPIAGHLNFGNNHLNGDTFEAVYAVAMHEVFHAMGFHSARMGKMIDAEGTVFNGVSSLTLGDSSSGTKTVHVISAPNVKRVAREHYGCSTIEGQELEDYGTSGSAGSHWEQRNVDYEVMAPQAASSNSKYGPRVSMLTLAFFADLGYYYPNYTAASPYAYGKGQGCGFVQRPARERSGDYNCPTELTSNRCNALAVGYSSCGWYEYSEEVSLFQRPDLSSPNRGGNQYSDYVAAASGYITCDSISASAAVQRGQTSGDASRCMYSKVAQRGYISGTFQAACYQLRCPNDPEYGTSASASTGGGSASTDYGSISDCEACADAGGVFCTDGGWRTVGGNYVKQGYCAATSCASGVITVRSAAQCYRDCTYGSKSGECRDASQCSSFGGLSYSSSSGADGCQSEPGTVRCCVDVGTRKRSLESESVVGKSTTAGKSAEKRAVGGVEVNVGGAWHTCPTAGGETSVGTSSAAYAGTLDCPSLDDACCAHLDYCSAHGTCRAGHCACDAGYTGVSCEVAAATAQLQAPARDDWRVSNHANMDELPSLDDDSYTLVRKEEDLPDNFGNDLRAADDDEQELDSGATDADTLALVIGGVVAALVLAAVAFGAVVFFVVQRRKQIARS